MDGRVEVEVKEELAGRLFASAEREDGSGVVRTKRGGGCGGGVVEVYQGWETQ